jgi:hypothetical protein
MRLKPRPECSPDPRCRGKRMYLARNQAVARLNGLKRKPQWRKEILGVYTCPFCAHLHIGHDINKLNGAAAK